MKIKLFGLGLLFGLGALLLNLVPAKASAFHGEYERSMNYSYEYPMYGQYYNDYGYSPYSRYYQNVTYPRTVYLVDAGNSANQLNIINATTGGSTTAARIVVPTYIYNQVVSAYNVLGQASIRVDLSTDRVVISTVNGTFSTYPILISFE